MMSYAEILPTVKIIKEIMRFWLKLNLIKFSLSDNIAENAKNRDEIGGIM